MSFPLEAFKVVGALAAGALALGILVGMGVWMWEIVFGRAID